MKLLDNFKGESIMQGLDFNSEEGMGSESRAIHLENVDVNDLIIRDWENNIC